MKIKMFVIAILLALQTALPSEAQRDLSRAINHALLSECVSKESTSVRVVDVHSGRVLYDRKGKKLLIPASVQKVIITAAALQRMGANYRFKTTFYRTGPVEKSVIKGDLIIRGGGDPKLVVEKVWLISQHLNHLGISKIDGDLVVDNTFFDTHKKAPSWNGRNSQRPHDARLGALSVNFNTIAVIVSPGEKPGDKLNAAILPKTDYVKLVNNGVTIGRKKHAIKAWHSYKNGKVMVTVSGKMGTGIKSKTIYLSVEDPGRYAGEVFKSYLAKAGVTVEGRVAMGHTPRHAALLMVHESEPLAVILRYLNKYSNNFIAEQIAKSMAAESSQSPGSHAKALQILRSFLNNLGVDMREVKLADASGLSRKNRMTTALTTDFLTKVYKRFDIGPDFVATLGIMGVDGSVRDRMKGAYSKVLSRVKTGSLSKVSSLAGYVSGAKGGLYSFAIFLNNVNCGYKEVDQIEDTIVTNIYKFASIER